MVIVVSAVLVLSFSIRFALCDLVTLIFNLGDFSFSRFGFNVRTDRQNHTHTLTQTPLVALLTPLSLTWVLTSTMHAVFPSHEYLTRVYFWFFRRVQRTLATLFWTTMHWIQCDHPRPVNLWPHYCRKKWPEPSVGDALLAKSQRKMIAIIA